MIAYILFVILTQILCFELGRRYEARRCNADMRRLGRHIDRQIQAHRDEVRRLAPIQRNIRT